MIVICDPINKSMSHEKVNSGFIYALRLAYPDDTIRFYADSTHIESIKSILKHDGVIISDIDYIAIDVTDFSSILGMIRCYALLKRIFSEVVDAGVEKTFFLTISPTVLFIIKKLKQKRKFISMKCTSVLHGSFESIAEKSNKSVGIKLPIENFVYKHDMKKYRQMSLMEFCRKGSRFVVAKVKARIPSYYISSLFLTDKKMLLWEHSTDFKYIALSPHIIANAEKYIDTKYLNIYTVMMPIAFANPIPGPNNEYVKFAIFGYGNSLMLHNILVKLAQRDISKNYEIRIIGMDSSGTQGFSHVTCTSKGGRLERHEMEEYVGDIDMFLILYDKSRYRLSCSGSILESLSYSKPILHFDNDCINSFNKAESPIGICCKGLDEFVGKMEDIIENYDSYTQKLEIFRTNISVLRNECAIENSLMVLRNSFTW